MFIEDPLRVPLLTVEWIFTILALELGLLFILKFISQEKQQRSSQELGYASFFFGLSLMWFFLILGDYYMSELIQSPFMIWSLGSTRNIFVNLSYLSLATGALLFSFSMEKHRTYLFKRFLFTSCFLALILTFITSFFINLDLIKYLSLMIWPLILIFLTIFFIDFFKSGMKKKSPLSNSLKFIPTFILVAMGFLFSNEIIMRSLGLELRFWGSSLQLISLGLLFYFFIKLPPLVEFGWKTKIEDLYVINQAGLCLIYTSFTGKEDETSEQLRSGALASINIILKSLTPSPKTKTAIIRKKGKTLTIYSGKLSTGVLVSTEELSTIKSNLKEFIQKFESIYYNVLLHFRCDTDVFFPMNAIIRKYFT